MGWFPRNRLRMSIIPRLIWHLLAYPDCLPLGFDAGGGGGGGCTGEGRHTCTR